MKAIQTMIGLAGIGVLVAACMGTDERARPASLPQVEAPITPEQAVSRITQARCDLEQQCGNIGEAKQFANMQHCLATHRDDLTRELGDDPDCRNGIRSVELDECLEDTRKIQCTGVMNLIDEFINTQECDSGSLCLD